MSESSHDILGLQAVIVRTIWLDRVISRVMMSEFDLEGL